MEAQLLIFDLDGTLIDSRADLAEAINHMRGQFGLEPLTTETISGYIGNGSRKLVERSLQGAAVDIEEAMRLNREYYYDHLTVHTTLYDGVAEGLRALVAAGHKLAVLTNKPGEPSRAILKYFGVADCFEAIVGGGDVERLKPEPDGVFYCMEQSGASKENVWMIGDHYTDLAVAQNADVRSALAQYGFGEERGYEPIQYFASFQALVGYFV